MTLSSEQFETTPAYANPGKCEGRSRTPGHVGRTPFQGPSEGRCQRPAEVWNEKQYAWLCKPHDAAAKRRKSP